MQPACIRLLPRLTARTLPSQTCKIPHEQICAPIRRHEFRLRRHFSSERNSQSDQRRDQRSKSTWKRTGVLAGLAVAGKVTWDGSQWLAQTNEQGAGSRTSFQNYTLIKKEHVSSTASIFHMQPITPSMLNLVEEDLKQGIINLEFKQPQIQVVRAYTPLPNIEPNGSLRFLIRKEPNGEVSSWLHRLPIGSPIEMRGPNHEYIIPPHTKRIVFLAGGTGIAPAIQAAHSLLRQVQTPDSSGVISAPRKQIHILWASRRKEDCVGGVSDLQTPSLVRRAWSAVTFQDPYAVSVAPSTDATEAAADTGLIVRELQQLKCAYPGQISVSYFVDEQSTFITEDTVRRTLRATAVPSPQKHNASLAPAPDTQILISGPDGFIAALAGPKIWVQGRQEQGPVGGVLGKVLRGDETIGASSVGVYKI